MSGAVALLRIPAAVLLVLLALAVRHAGRRHGGGVIAWRWLTGHPWHGQHVTDAGWFAPATKVLHPTGHASRWSHRPRAIRAAARTLGTAAAAAALWGLAAHRTATLRSLGVLAALGLLAAIAAAWRAALAWRHYRASVRPLHIALGRALGVPAAANPRTWLDVPRGYASRDGGKVTIYLPAWFSGGADARKGITEIVGAKLALEDPRASWDLTGPRPRVTYTVQVPPPARVSLGDVRELIAAAAPTAPLLGLGRAGKPVYADLDGDSPHVLISAGSGGGKSVTTRTLVAQILANGGVCLVLDVKRLSHAWARGLPNVRYCRDIAEIHEALLWLGTELDRRNQLADEGADSDGNTDHVDVGPRLIVLAEEMNATINRLAAYWRSIKGRDDPSVSPAIEAFGDALFMGRQVRVNVLAVAQMLTARTVGGPEARENMGVRILARYTLNAWRVLVPEIWPAPRSSKHRGRVQVCVAGKARETQIAFLAPSEARALATSGTVAAFPASGSMYGGIAQGDALRVVQAPAPVGLAAAIDAGLMPGLTLAAVRKARQRDPEFPVPIGQGSGGELLYAPDELRRWAANRPRALTAAGS